MSEGLNMSLDDLIKNNKKSGASSRNSRPQGQGQGQGQGRDRDRGTGPGPGPVRRFANRGPPRPTPYIPPQAIQLQEPYIGGGRGIGEGTKLYISNLESGVSNEDIKVLFSEVGELKRYSIHYDRSGRSKGTAEVVFVRQSDALGALKRYNNLQLDGKPMNIELVGMNLVTPVVIPPTSRGILGNPVGPSQRFDSRQERAAGRGWDRRGGGGHGFGRSRRQGRATNEKLSIEDLDADLENYRLEAMQIN